MLAVLVGVPLYFAATAPYVSVQANSSSMTGADQISVLGCGLAIVLSGAFRPCSSALIGLGHLVAERATQAAGTTTRALLTIAALLSQPSHFGFVAAAEAAQVVVPPALACLALVRLRRFNLRGRPRVQTLRAMLSYSTKSFAVSATGALILQAGPIVLGVVSTPADVSLFSGAYRIYTGARQAIGWATDPLRPAYSRLFARTTSTQWPLMRSILSITLAAAVSLSGFLSLTATPITSIWLGPERGAQVAPIVVWLLAGLMLNAIHLPLSPIADGRGEPGAFFLAQVTWLVCYVGLAIPLGSLLGGLGVSVALTSPMPGIETLYLLRASHVLGFSLRDWLRDVLTPVALPAALLAGPAWIVADTFHSEVSSFACGLVWLVALLSLFLGLRRHPPLLGASQVWRMEV